MPNWLYFLVEWVVPLLMVPVVARGRRPFVAISWLAFIFAVPWLGLPVYLLIGEVGLRRDARDHERVRRAVEGRGDRRRQEQFELPAREFEPYRSVPEVANQLFRRGLDGGNPVLTGNAVEILENEVVLERLVADIDAAAHHVHLIFFIFAPDDTGRRVTDALLRAASRGVRCRVLVDAWASKAMMKELAPPLRRGGVSVHRVLRISALRRPLRRVDIRNHRKVAVVDIPEPPARVRRRPRGRPERRSSAPAPPWWG